MKGHIKVMLVEDHELVRAGLRALLENVPDVEVVAEASDGREALRKIEVFGPDIVLMDIALPEMNGLETTAFALERFPATKVIILSMYSNEEYVWQALRAGATGYLLKNASTSELELALKAVARGESYLSPPVSTQLVQDFTRRAKGEPSSLERLTPRQRQILQLIARGHTTQQIADELTISPKTVETHRTQLMQRLEIFDIAGLVRYAVHMGLVMPNE
jgi:DNA-binding NarL/FixJ family response regulator